MNYKLIATQLGDSLKYAVSLNQINRVAKSIFEFDCKSYPNENMTSSRSQTIYDWVMSLANTQIEENQKKSLLQSFIYNLTPEGDPVRKLVGNGNNLADAGFWSVIHPSIISIAKKKFEDGHYADAVESAFKEINSRVQKIVKQKTGRELDGVELMQNAFSEKNPIIILDNISTKTGRNIQLGYMQLFSGAMMGIRNPKAHNNLTIMPERAIHFIYLASLFMYKLDEAKGKRKRRSYVPH